MAETVPQHTDVLAVQVGPTRYTVQIPETVMDGVKDALLRIEYTGDIGSAFISGRMIRTTSPTVRSGRSA